MEETVKPIVRRDTVRLKVTGVAAVAKNRVIGIGEAMAWGRIQEDMTHFVNVTRGKPILYGSGTVPSFGGKALPRRPNYVLSKSGYQLEGATTVESFHKAFEAIALSGETEVILLGGATIYEQGLKYCDELIITELDLEPEGDKFFPEILPEEWEEVSREPMHDEATGISGHFVTYRARKEKPVVCYPRNGRNPEYRADLIALNTLGECPFCWGGKTILTQPPVYENSMWFVTQNAHPWEGVKLHFLLIPKTGVHEAHPLRYEELGAGRHHLLDDALRHLKQQFGFDTGLLAWREGLNTDTIGATVVHLHAQYYVLEPGAQIAIDYGQFPIDAP